MKLSWSQVGIKRLPLHGTDKFALVDGDYDGEYLGQFTWRLRKDGYVFRDKYRSLDGNRTGVVYLHDVVCRKAPGLWIDHINRNKLDNRSTNLRAVTPSVNLANRGSFKRSAPEKVLT